MKKIVILIFVTVLIATTWIYFDGSKMDNSILDEKDIYVILERFMDISGTFESPILYKIPIIELTD